MPFLIRPSRRFPVQCSVTYNTGPFQGQGTIWNLSVNGWRLYGDVPMRPEETLSLKVTLPNESTKTKTTRPHSQLPVVQYAKIKLKYFPNRVERRHSEVMMPLSLTILLSLLAGCATSSSTPPDATSPRQHSESVFQRLQQEESQHRQPRMAAEGLAVPVEPTRETEAPQSHEPYLVATGYGDLSKGPLICQRVADTAARAELAKLIRVHVKEHATDRLRERTGQPFEQDIEVVREEMTNELLQDVRIIDRRMDPVAGTCSSAAVMPNVRKLSDRADKIQSVP